MDNSLEHIINKLRLQNKGNWYFRSFMHNNKPVDIKGFGTWLQIFRVNGIDYSSPMEQSVKAFKAHIRSVEIRAI